MALHSDFAHSPVAPDTTTIMVTRRGGRTTLWISFGYGGWPGCVCVRFFIWTLAWLAVQNKQTNKQSFLCTTDRMGELGPRGNSADGDRIGWRVGAHRRRNGNVPRPVFVWVGEGREPSHYDKHHYKSDFIAVGADSKKKLIHSCSVRMTIDDKRINVHWRMFARVFS